MSISWGFWSGSQSETSCSSSQGCILIATLLWSTELMGMYWIRLYEANQIVITFKAIRTATKSNQPHCGVIHHNHVICILCLSRNIYNQQISYNVVPAAAPRQRLVSGPGHPNRRREAGGDPLRPRLEPALHADGRNNHEGSL